MQIAEQTVENEDEDGRKTLVSPLTGQVVPLNEVEDPAFSSGALGQGIAVLPEEGKLYAPADGQIVSFFPTGHAIGMLTDSGEELLIHVGMDTVKLNGDGFTPRAKQGDSVKKGDLLLEFDIEKINAAGYSTVTPVLVTNSPDYAEISGTDAKHVNHGEKLISLRKKEGGAV